MADDGARTVKLNLSAPLAKAIEYMSIDDDRDIQSQVLHIVKDALFKGGYLKRTENGLEAVDQWLTH